MLFNSTDVHPYASFWLDLSDKVLKAAAVLIGGLWAWFNFRKSRTYKRRLEADVSGEIFARDGRFYLAIVCHLKNVGLGVYEIQQKGTACVVTALNPPRQDRLEILQVFGDHAWIEPGEEIDDPLLIEAPNPNSFVALRLDLRVVSGGIEWNGKCDVRFEDPATHITRYVCVSNQNGNQFADQEDKPMTIQQKLESIQQTAEIEAGKLAEPLIEAVTVFQKTENRKTTEEIEAAKQRENSPASRRIFQKKEDPKKTEEIEKGKKTGT